MNRLLNFFKENKKVEVTTKHELEDTSPNYFLKSCKLAAMSLALISTLNFPIEVANAASIKENIPFALKIDNLLNDYQKIGVLDKNNLPNIKIVDSSEHSSSSHIAGILKSCDINISLDSKERAESLIPDVEINFNNDIYREASLNHEIAHCYNNKAFKGSGLSKSSEKWMTEWVIGDYVKSNPVKSLYEENFADTYGMMLTLSNHNFSKESKILLKKWMETRKIQRIDDEKQGHDLLANSHQTDFALQYLYENLDKVQQMNIKDYPTFAMQAASRSVMYTLNSKRVLANKMVLSSNGDWVKSDAKNYVGGQGKDALNQVLNSYRDNILDYAKVLKYQTTINPEILSIELNNEIPEITRKVINSTNVFEKVNISTTRINNHELTWNIEGGDQAKTEVFVMINGKKLDFEMDKIKEEYNYNAFIKNADNVLKSVYVMDEAQVIVNKMDEIRKAKASLLKSPFEMDRASASKMKMK